MPAPKKTTTKTAAKKPAAKSVAKKAASKTAPKKAATAKKTVAAKKTVSTTTEKKPAAKKTSTPAKKPAAKKTSTAKKAAVVAAIDVGFGNRLTIRGEGAGLSWTTGQTMDWQDGQWVWKPAKTGAFNFKVLLNDEVWSQGENVAADGKKEIVVTPQF